MILSRMKSLLSAGEYELSRRRFRDTPVRHVSLAAKKDVSPIRLVGYFVGGILLANLVLMTSSAFRGHSAQATAHQSGELPKRGPVAAAAAERALAAPVATEAETNGVASQEIEPEFVPEVPKPVIVNLCADAREKLVAGLTLYYLQRSRRPHASNDEVLESAGASALLAGPADPAALPSGTPCAG
jgi:hypothetical protein